MLSLVALSGFGILAILPRLGAGIVVSGLATYKLFPGFSSGELGSYRE